MRLFYHFLSVLVVIFILPLHCIAESDLSVSVSTQVLGEASMLTVKVINPNKSAVHDVVIRNMLPEEAQYVKQQDNSGYIIDSIPGNGSVERRFCLRRTNENHQRIDTEELLRISTETKAQYTVPDTALINVTIENLTGSYLENIDITNALPYGMDYPYGQEFKGLLIPDLAPYGLIHLELPLFRDDYGQLKISLMPNKVSYFSNETARLFLNIENRSHHEAINVNIGNILPVGFQYAPEQKETQFHYDMLHPGESRQEVLLVQKITSTAFDLPPTGDSMPNIKDIGIVLVLSFTMIAIVKRMGGSKK